MYILIQINPSLETRLREKAAVKGLALNQFISQFLELIEEIELANARRITVLAELAQIRNVPIRVLMEQLGIALNHE